MSGVGLYKSPQALTTQSCTGHCIPVPTPNRVQFTTHPLHVHPGPLLHVGGHRSLLQQHVPRPAQYTPHWGVHVPHLLGRQPTEVPRPRPLALLDPLLPFPLPVRLLLLRLLRGLRLPHLVPLHPVLGVPTPASQVHRRLAVQGRGWVDQGVATTVPGTQTQPDCVRDCVRAGPVRSNQQADENGKKMLSPLAHPVD